MKLTVTSNLCQGSPQDFFQHQF